MIIGGYVKHLWKQKEDTELRIQELNESKYRSILVYMRLVLKPENVMQFNLDDPYLQTSHTFDEIKKHVKEKLVEHYYNSILYASDNVLKMLKQFIDNPTDSNFIKTAVEMRKDLWKKRSKINIPDIE